MKLSKLKLIIELILILSITALIGMIIWDYFDMKKSDKYAGGMINEIDKIINEHNEYYAASSNSDEDLGE